MSPRRQRFVGMLRAWPLELGFQVPMHQPMDLSIGKGLSPLLR